MLFIIFISVLGGFSFLYLRSLKAIYRNKLLKEYIKFNKHYNLPTKFSKDNIFDFKLALYDFESFDSYELIDADNFYESIYKGIENAKKI